MEPIISPWLIYLLGIIEQLQGFLTIMAVFSGIGFFFYIIFAIAYGIEMGDGAEKAKKSTTFFVWLFPILILLSIITPNRNTLIGMIVSQHVTHHTIQKTVETGKAIKEEIKKDILDIIDQVTKKQSDQKK